MASVLEFRRSALQARLLTARGASATADIIFFPGVRYERQADEPMVEKKQIRRTRRRDRLELDD